MSTYVYGVAGWLVLVGSPVLGALRTVHSGHIGDYVAWMFAAVAALAAAVGMPLT